MVGQHHQLNGHESEQTLGDSEGQGILAYCGPWDFPGKSTGVGCHFLPQRIFPTQGSNPGLLCCRQMFYHLSHQGSPQSWLKLMSIELVMPYNHLILCCTLFLLPSIVPSIRVFFNESVLCIRWPKDWSFSFSISPSTEY